MDNMMSRMDIVGSNCTIGYRGCIPNSIEYLKKKYFSAPEAARMAKKAGPPSAGPAFFEERENARLLKQILKLWWTSSSRKYIVSGPKSQIPVPNRFRNTDVY